MNKVKQSNFELMRITSMFLIIIYHIIYHGKMLINSNGTILLILQLIICITLVHVNSFILITGYFQYNKKFLVKNFLKNYSAAIFYKVIIAIILISSDIIESTNINYLNLINPFYISYWFISCYLIIYLLSPFFQHLNKKYESTYT